jgi:putrescine transport system ATP-binding protein
MSEPTPPNPSQTPFLVARNLCVSYKKAILKNLNLELYQGETLVVLGQSGCGKTTLLKALAGMLKPDQGEILLRGVSLESLTAKARKIIYLDQEPLLFDHLNIFENIAFPLRIQNLSNATIREQTETLLSLIEMTDHGRKQSWEISGGQKQRVAFARAIQAEPQVLLLDEPFCSLDDRTRNTMQVTYRKLHHQFNFSAIFVTHDVREALSVGDRFALMTDGRMTFYETKKDFIDDETTGVKAEIAFWKEISKVDQCKEQGDE